MGNKNQGQKSNPFEKIMEDLFSSLRKNGGTASKIDDKIVDGFRNKIIALQRERDEKDKKFVEKRAECTRLAAQVTELTSLVEDLIRQRDAAKAEVERLKKK